jgi:hypothetical protein
LHPVNDQEVFCAQKPGLVLPVEGAPLVFSTRYAHDLVLRVTAKDGQATDLPVRPDPEHGGLSVDTSSLDAARFGDLARASLRGHWGFATYAGPEFKLQIAGSRAWQPSHDDQQALLGGGEVTVHLKAAGAACVERVTMQAGSAKPNPVSWTASSPDELTVKTPLGKSRPPSLVLAVQQYGLSRPDEVKLLPVAAHGRVDSLEIHAGDTSGLLKGTRLGEVAQVTLAGAKLLPGALVANALVEELSLTTADGAKLPPAGEVAEAKIAFKDGRTAALNVTVAPARPEVSLIQKSFRLDDPAAGVGRIQLTDADLVPEGAQLTFSLRAEAPAAFRGDEKIEVAGPDGRTLATLTPSSGVVFADSRVAIATLDTAKAFNGSVAGALRFRVLRAEAPSNWLPLATLVRLPRLGPVKCPPDPKKLCALGGSELFLIDALSNNPAFRTPVEVPEGFTAATLETPRPAAGKLYLKLHDDPAVVNVVTLAPPNDHSH